VYLTSRKENIGMQHGDKRIYKINTQELANVLRSNGYDDLLKSISWLEALTTQTTFTTLTKNGEEGEGNESGEDIRLEDKKNFHVLEKYTFDQFTDLRKLQEYICVTKNKNGFISKKSVFSFIKNVLNKKNPES